MVCVKSRDNIGDGVWADYGNLLYYGSSEAEQSYILCYISDIERTAYVRLCNQQAR